MLNRCLKHFKMLAVLFCVGLVSVFVLNCSSGGGGGGGGDNDDNGNNIPQTFTASGTYTYNPDTGELVLTFTSSDFIACGPVVGVEDKDIDPITVTTMHWIEDDMTWERDSGTAGDILGTWDWVDERPPPHNPAEWFPATPLAGGQRPVHA